MSSSSTACGQPSAATPARYPPCGPTIWPRWSSGIVARTGIDPAMIEEVYFGCANQAGEDNRNVARMGALLAGLPHAVAGVTINRLCASGLNAVNQAARPSVVARATSTSPAASSP